MDETGRTSSREACCVPRDMEKSSFEVVTLPVMERLEDVEVVDALVDIDYALY